MSASYSTQSTASTKTKGSKYVCFTISRGDGLPDEKWIEIVDTASTLNYYFNPQTWVTAASPSVSSSLSRQSHPMGYSNSHQEAVINPSDRALLRPLRGMKRPHERKKSRRFQAQNSIVSLEGACIWSSRKAKPHLGGRETIPDEFSEDLGQVYFFDETAATRKKR
jgi:hypothetical protein